MPHHPLKNLKCLFLSQLLIESLNLYLLMLHHNYKTKTREL